MKRLLVLALVLAACGGDAVSKKVTFKARGLSLSPSDLETPDGSLSQADNVVISRDGIVETRRGQEPMGSQTIRRLFPYKDAIVGHDGSSTLLRSSDSGATWTAYGPPVTPQTGVPLRVAQMQSNLYLTDGAATKRIDSLTSTPEEAGVPAALDVDLTLSSAGTPTAMPTNSQLAYRVLFFKRDANGRLIMGAPSGRAVITNSSGSTRDVAVNFSLPRGLDSSHRIQVYRSTKSVDANTDPGDELGLVAEGAMPAAANITQLVRATNVVTATTSAAHGYATGQIVRVGPGGSLAAHGVAVGASSSVSRTTDNGATWSNSGISGLSGSFYGASSSGALYVAVGASVCATSSDGLTWTARTIPAGTYKSVVWTGSVWVAVGDSVAATSPDGTTWTARTIPAHSYRSVAWNGAMLVAVGFGQYVATSPDGTTWTDRGHLTGYSLESVTWTGSSWVAVGRGGIPGSPTNKGAATSPDGITWTSRTTPDDSYRAVAVIGSTTVAVGEGGAASSSDNGATWTWRTIPDGLYYGLGISGSSLVAVGNSSHSGGPNSAITTDGITWTPKTIASGTYYLAFCSGGGATFSPGEKTITGTPTTTTFTYAETGTNGTLTQAQTVDPLTAAVLDTVPDGFIGASLYTNENQEGILNANERPPVAKDLAEFKGSLFAANITTPAYGDAYLIAVGGANGIQSGDTVTINGLAYTGASSESTSARQFKVYTTGSVAQNIRDTAASLIRVVNRSLSSGITLTDISDSAGVPGHIAFRARDCSSSLTVTFSRTTAWSPASGISVSPKNYKNGFVWSKTDQPDSFPTSGILLPTLIGSADKAILRAIATRSSLFLLKEDGVWRLTGGAGAWDVQPFDPTIRIVAPETAIVLDNTIWALSEQGVVRISDTGTAVVSRSIEPALLAAISPALKSTTAAYAFAVPYESDRKFLLWLPESASDTKATRAYVYDLFTQAWTSRTDDAAHGFVNPADDRLYLSDAAIVSRERKTLTDADLQDATDVAIQTIVTWAPHFGDDPFGSTEFQAVHLLWDRVQFTTASVGFATNHSPAVESVPLNGSDYACSASPVEGLRVEVWPPASKTWGSELRVTVSHAQARAPNAIAGLEVVYIGGGGSASR